KYTFGSGIITGIGSGTKSFSILNSPVATSDVKLTLTAFADLGLSSEYLSVNVGGSGVGDMFVATGTDCPATTERDSISIPMATWNTAQSAGSGSVLVSLTSSPDVGPDVCGNQLGMAYVAAFIEYDQTPDRCIQTLPLVLSPFSDAGTCVKVDSPPLGPDP